MRRYFLVEFEGEDEDMPPRQSLSDAIEACDKGLIEMNWSGIVDVEYISGVSDVEEALS